MAVWTGCVSAVFGEAVLSCVERICEGCVNRLCREAV
jgi:hypothetical protein